MQAQSGLKRVVQRPDKTSADFLDSLSRASRSTARQLQPYLADLQMQFVGTRLVGTELQTKLGREQTRLMREQAKKSEEQERELRRQAECLAKLLAIHSLASTYKFTIDIRPGLWYGSACYLEQAHHPPATLTHLDSALPRAEASCTIFVQITPSE